MIDVSVIIPTWNRSHAIKSAVMSVLNQTYRNLEVLICDDGSTDNTKEIILSINDSRVRWIEGSRGGRPAIPRNRGIKKAQGEWIAFLDSDDEWLPEKLYRQLEILDSSKVKAGCTNAFRVIPGSNEFKKYLEYDLPVISFNQLVQGNYVICSSVIIHKSVMNELIGFPEAEELKALEDYALWLKAATLTDFGFIAEPLVLYRDDPLNSVRNQVKNDFFYQRRVLFQDFYAWAKKNPDKKKFTRLFRHRNYRFFISRIILYFKSILKRIIT